MYENTWMAEVSLAKGVTIFPFSIFCQIQEISISYTVSFKILNYFLFHINSTDEGTMHQAVKSPLDVWQFLLSSDVHLK